MNYYLLMTYTGGFYVLSCGLSVPIFADNIPPSSRLLLDQYVEKTLNLSFGDMDVKAIDLNRDGLDEFIFKPKSCPGGHICLFQIVAEQDQKIKFLGEVSARALKPGDHYTNGVRDLLAFSSPTNDYVHDIYRWEPRQSRYILAGQ